MKFAILILFLCLSTYIPRMLPALFMEKIQVSGKVNIFLQLIPYTAMASLIFPAILYVDKNRLNRYIGDMLIYSTLMMSI